MVMGGSDNVGTCLSIHAGLGDLGQSPPLGPQTAEEAWTPLLTQSGPLRPLPHPRS